MKTTLMLAVALAAATMLAAPAAADHLSPENVQEDVQECVDHQPRCSTVDELNPRNWPCTCDPQPDPW